MLDAYSQLIKALRVLPNVGAKTAQRMAYVLLQQNRQQKSYYRRWIGR